MIISANQNSQDPIRTVIISRRSTKGIVIKILDWDTADLDKLAELTWEARLASPLWTEGQSVEVFRNYIESSQARWPDSILLGAYRNQELAGWLALITEDPLVFELWRWHPFIRPGEQQESVAAALLGACKKITRERGAQSLEVWGRRLVSASVRAAGLGEEDIFSIGVDLSNQAAYQLYRSLGFEPRSKLVTHIWMNGS